MANFNIGEIHGNALSVVAKPAGRTCSLALYFTTDIAGTKLVQLVGGGTAVFYSASFTSTGIAQPVSISVDTTKIPDGTYYAFIAGYMDGAFVVVQAQSEQVTISSGIILGGDTVSTQNVVTSQRAYWTVYQNNTGKPMFVAVSPWQGRWITAILTDSNPEPTTGVACNVTGINIGIPVFFIVLPGNYYEVTTSQPNYAESAQYWTEWY